jgi:antitoxin component YwqK of YwqJK toxin-antitoxin module
MEQGVRRKFFIGGVIKTFAVIVLIVAMTLVVAYDMNHSPGSIAIGKQGIFYTDGLVAYIGHTIEGDISTIEGWEEFTSNLIPHGKGRLLFRTGSVLYDGDWNMGKRTGYGISYFPGGQVEYEGLWLNNKWHGEGKAYRIDGSILAEGVWKNGMLDGFAVTYYADGNIEYEGEWSRGVWHGEILTII